VKIRDAFANNRKAYEGKKRDLFKAESFSFCKLGLPSDVGTSFGHSVFLLRFSALQPYLMNADSLFALYTTIDQAFIIRLSMIFRA
jgi:hypothetical protein